MTRLVVGPFNRVEGDLEVTLEVEAGRVGSARVCSPLYRGFEQILDGKAPTDALVFVPRICGICSVAQSAAAAQALGHAMGLSPPDNGRLAANLVLGCENVADHLTHFYLFFMPDFARREYAARPLYAATRARFAAQSGSATAEVLPARAQLLHLMGLLAGKWPHSLALQPGGSTRAVLAAEKIRLFVILREFRAFAEQTLFGAPLERVAALDSLAALEAFTDEGGDQPGDLRRFLRLARELDLAGLGRGVARFMSYGAYPAATGHLFAAGVWDGARRPLDPADIREDATHAWLADSAPRHPAVGLTSPMPDKEGAYTFCKAPRLGGHAVEVGALARQVVDGQPLCRDLLQRGGGRGDVRARVVARLLEIARVVPAMEAWAAALEPGAAFCHAGEVPDEATGFGLVEAARGSLGHWLTASRGRLTSYQIVAPTTWNFSPRDAAGTPGPLEQALVGAPAAAEGEGEAAVAVQHVVRSFDPCMVCTVH